MSLPGAIKNWEKGMRSGVGVSHKRGRTGRVERKDEHLLLCRLDISKWRLHMECHSSRLLHDQQHCSSTGINGSWPFVMFKKSFSYRYFVLKFLMALS